MNVSASMRAMAVLLSLSHVGCLLTQGLASVATSPHPSFKNVPTVGAAALHQDDLYLRLDQNVEAGQPSQPRQLIARVRLKDVEALPAPTTFQAFPDWPAFPRLPIHLRGARAIPSDAQPVQVSRITVRNLEELEALESTIPSELQLFVVMVDESEGRRGHLVVDQKMSGPIIVIVTPAEGSGVRVAKTRSFEERPRLRRAWFAATPLTVAGDIITFPFQFFLLLAVGC